ncbi:MAG: hypothetical protein K6E91_14290 [Butyrivibrio sp.]|nr:hypothetical protein [Butyrivibrio sp.]
MESKLARMFDYQKYESNSRLDRIIRDVESRYSDGMEVMSDDELGMLNAAGTTEIMNIRNEK